MKSTTVGTEVLLPVIDKIVRTQRSIPSHGIQRQIPPSLWCHLFFQLPVNVRATKGTLRTFFVEPLGQAKNVETTHATHSSTDTQQYSILFHRSPGPGSETQASWQRTGRFQAAGQAGCQAQQGFNQQQQQKRGYRLTVSRLLASKSGKVLPISHFLFLDVWMRAASSIF
jgi:hypothetical protein